MKFAITALLALASMGAFAQDCCKSKAEKKTAHAAAPACEDKKISAEQEFMLEAQRMAMAAEGKKACCKSTPAKAVEKGAPGCCNAKGESAKFKVFVAGKGYQFFGCEGSATKGRTELLAKGEKVGSIQKVSSNKSKLG